MIGAAEVDGCSEFEPVGVVGEENGKQLRGVARKRKERVLLNQSLQRRLE